MKKLRKITACALCFLLVCGTATPASAAAAQESAVTKDENVFVILNEDGSIQKQIVSDWLHCDAGLTGVKDHSSLENIQNLKGDTQPQKDGSTLTWDTNETDLYYQGTATQTPPVISYELDGKILSAEELSGKSGHLKMTIALTNHEKAAMEIDGVERTIYTPFATVIAADLPVETFQNIKAEHGTVQTDSSNQVACFLAMPGMSESFDGLLTGELSSLGNLLLDEVSIEADVTDFKMPALMMACAANPEGLESEEENVPGLNSLSSDLDQLRDATNELTSGTKSLSSATAEMDTKLGQFASSYQVFDQGVKNASSGASQLNSNVALLSAKIGELNQGTSTLQSNLNSAVPLISSAAQKKAELAQSLTELKKELAGITLPDKDEISTQMKAQLATALGSAAANGAGMAKQSAIQALQENGADQSLITAVSNAIDPAVIAPQASGKVDTSGISNLLNSLDFSALAGLQTKLDGLETQATGLMNNMDLLLSSLYNAQNPSDQQTVFGTVNAIAEGTRQLNEKMPDLKKGTSSLAAGLGQLAGSSKTVSSAIGQFQSGAGQLSEGAAALNSGMQTYAEAGIGKLLDSAELSSLTTIQKIAEQMKKRADSYTSYTGAPDGVKASVKFIMKVADNTDSSASEENGSTEESSQTALAQQTGFWDRVKNLFS